MKSTSALFTAVIFSFALRAQTVKLSVGADLIVFHAKITTQTAAQPEASALAVKAGRIYAVGNDDDILQLKDVNTQR